MRTGYGLVVGVLAAVLAGTGCCKLCDWCRGPSDSRKVNEGPPAKIEERAWMPEGPPREANIVPDQPYGGNPPAQGAAGAKPAARTGPTGQSGQTGAYGGTQN